MFISSQNGYGNICFVNAKRQWLGVATTLSSGAVRNYRTQCAFAMALFEIHPLD
jgi:hypothetical protein